MATMLPRQQPPASRQSHDFTPSSPPERVMFHQPPSENPVAPSLPFESSMEFRRQDGPGFANGAGALLPMPHGPQPMPNGGSRHRATMSLGVFDGGKSPPANKNTSHVPCKFFRSGQCQAGPACPFSHSIDISTNETPCKYFAKGNCKFGQKCALAHVLSDGRIINRPNGGVRCNMGLGPRIDPQLYQQSDPVLAQSLLAQQGNGIPPPFGQQLPLYSEIDIMVQQDNLTPRPFDRPPREYELLGEPESKYGSPREDSRFASLSSTGRLSLLDAPLPPSFDSQGVSWARQHGHVAASLPTKLSFLESSPSGSLQQKNHVPLDSIRNLQAPPFTGRDSRHRREDLGSSPLGSGDEGFGQRFMHSRRVARPKMVSTSLPRFDLPVDDSDSDFHFSGGEEDYIPTSLHDQIFTRDEQQQRRYSRTEQDRRAVRESLSGIVTPADSSKVGSPSAGSPSRFGTLFARQQQDQSAHISISPSAFGHVGSPLRKSSLHPGTSPSARAAMAADMSSSSFPSLSSPPRQTSMSELSQQLSRTRLSTNSNPPNDSLSINYSNNNINNKSLHPNRHSSLPITTNNNNGNITSTTTNTLLNRALSTSSSGRNTDRIIEEEEEQGGEIDTVFDMEEDLDALKKNQRRSGGSGGRHAWVGVGINPGKASPRLGPIGTGRGSGDFT